MRVGIKEINAFSEKIKEAIKRLQPTLPKQLSEGDIVAITELVRAYVINTLSHGCGMHISLDSLIEFAVMRAKNEIPQKDAPNKDEESEQMARARDMISASPALSKLPEKHLDENIPALEIFLSTSYIGMANPEGQMLYSTDERESKASDYFLKSHAKFMRDRAKKEKEQEDEQKE